MLFSRLQRALPEKVYTVVSNISGATITTGYPVNLAIGVSNDGVSAQIANAAALYPGFIGVAVKDIAINDYGLVQIAGFVNSVLISAVGTSITITAGDPLVPAPAGFFSALPAYANAGFRWLAASNVPAAVSAASYASGLLKMI